MSVVFEDVWPELNQYNIEHYKYKCNGINYTQYLFPDYGYLTNRGVLGKYSFAYVNLGNLSYACQLLKSNYIKIVCLNDSGSVDFFEDNKKTIQETLNRRFPEKSRFEL